MMSSTQVMRAYVRSICNMSWSSQLDLQTMTRSPMDCTSRPSECPSMYERLHKLNARACKKQVCLCLTNIADARASATAVTKPQSYHKNDLCMPRNPCHAQMHNLYTRMHSTTARVNTVSSSGWSPTVLLSISTSPALD